MRASVFPGFFRIDFSGPVQLFWLGLLTTTQVFFNEWCESVYESQKAFNAITIGKRAFFATPIKAWGHIHIPTIMGLLWVRRGVSNVSHTIIVSIGGQIIIWVRWVSRLSKISNMYTVYIKAVYEDYIYMLVCKFFPFYKGMIFWNINKATKPLRDTMDILKNLRD